MICSYLQGNNPKALTFSPANGETTTVAGVIGDDKGSTTIGAPGYTEGTAGITLNGPGTLVLTAENTYTGGTTIKAGTLELGNGGSIKGNVKFAGANATLQLDTANSFNFNQFGGIIKGFSSGDVIYLPSEPLPGPNPLPPGFNPLAWKQNGPTGTLSIIDGTTTLDTFTLAGKYTLGDFLASTDGRGGTKIINITSAPPSPDFSHYLCTIPGFARRVDSRFRNVLARGAGGRERGWDFIGAAGGSKRLISVGLG